MADKAKEIKTEKKKNEESIIDTILKGVSYGTGVLVRAAADIGKVKETKTFKNAVSKAEDLCDKVNANTKVMLKKANKAVKENISDLKESFKEGVKSGSGETMKSKTIDSPAIDKAPDDSEVKVKEISVSQKIPSKARIEKKTEEPAKQPSDNIKKTTIEAPKKNKKYSLAAKKAQSKEKSKAMPKKAGRKIMAGKKAPIDADLEREIEDTTKDVDEV